MGDQFQRQAMEKMNSLGLFNVQDPNAQLNQYRQMQLAQAMMQGKMIGPRP